MASAADAAPALAPATRIEAAFEELRSKHRILVEESCACCCSCGHAHCRGELARHPEAVGYAFFHAQDLDFVADGELWLGHAARDDLLDRIVPLVMRSVLEDHGFEADWSGSPEVRLRVLVPEGPERAYFRRMLEEEWADYDDDEEEGCEEEDCEEGEGPDDQEAAGGESGSGSAAGAAAGTEG
ncbi:hypothetical protein ABPG75_012574 [Micractinium tetrahymenae]